MPLRTAHPNAPSGQGVRKVSRFLATLFALTLLFTTIPQVDAITQSDINALKAQREQISNNKSAISQKISVVKNDKEQAVQRKVLLEEQIDVLRQEISVIDSIIRQYDAQISDKAAELAKAEAEEARYFELFCTRVRAMEESGDVSYWSILFDSSDFSDLIDRMNLIGEIMDYDNRTIDALQEARDAVAEAKSQLESLRGEQVEAKQSLQASQNELKTQQAEVDALVNEMEAKAKEYEKQLSAFDEDFIDLSNEIAAAESKYAAQLAAQNPSGGGGTATLTGSGGFIWPLPSRGTITSPYGSRTDPFSGRSSTHLGTDIAMKAGTNIFAAKAGTVVISTFHASYGNYVVIAHADGSRTLYAHMRQRVAVAGQSVSQGQVIGYVGTTGSSTGNHLHFEVWRGSTGSTRTNPMQFF